MRKLFPFLLNCRVVPGDHMYMMTCQTMYYYVPQLSSAVGYLVQDHLLNMSSYALQIMLKLS